MPIKLFYNETHYDCTPPVDINPLILQAFKRKDILVIPTREGMKNRIQKMILESTEPLPKIYTVGIWELQDHQLVINGKAIATNLKKYDAILIIGKERAHKNFKTSIRAIENFVNEENHNP